MNYDENKINRILQRENISKEEYIELSFQMLQEFGVIPFDIQMLRNREEYDHELFSEQPLNKIHPRKRAIIEKLIKTDKPESIQEIWIFGSSITLYCKEFSDIDMFIVIDTEENYEEARQWIKSFDYFSRDVLIDTKESLMSKRDQGLKREVRETGLIVWSRNND